MKIANNNCSCHFNSKYNACHWNMLASPTIGDIIDMLVFYSFTNTK
ncbi:hypothetical protein GCM10023142_31700 [Anaerocolumna aminovalerica]